MLAYLMSHFVYIRTSYLILQLLYILIQSDVELSVYTYIIFNTAIIVLIHYLL